MFTPSHHTATHCTTLFFPLSTQHNNTYTSTHYHACACSLPPPLTPPTTPFLYPAPFLPLNFLHNLCALLSQFAGGYPAKAAPSWNPSDNLEFEQFAGGYPAKPPPSWNPSDNLEFEQFAGGYPAKAAPSWNPSDNLEFEQFAGGYPAKAAPSWNPSDNLEFQQVWWCVCDNKELYVAPIVCCCCSVLQRVCCSVCVAACVLQCIAVCVERKS